MNKLDFLFISPLGWDKFIWKKIIENNSFQNKNIGYIEYTGANLKNKKEIYEELSYYINKLKPHGTVITSSYGTITFLNFFKNNKRKLYRLIVLEGLDTIPNIKIIETELNKDKEKIEYKNEQEYLDFILDKNEYNYEFKKELCKKNIKKKNDKYELITKRKDILHYLSLFQEINIKDIINEISHEFENIIIYADNEKDIAIKTNIVINKNKKEHHLIMLENEKEIINLLT